MQTVGLKKVRFKI